MRQGDKDYLDELEQSVKTVEKVIKKGWSSEVNEGLKGSIKLFQHLRERKINNIKVDGRNVLACNGYDLKALIYNGFIYDVFSHEHVIQQADRFLSDLRSEKEYDQREDDQHPAFVHGYCGGE